MSPSRPPFGGTKPRGPLCPARCGRRTPPVCQPLAARRPRPQSSIAVCRFDRPGHGDVPRGTCVPHAPRSCCRRAPSGCRQKRASFVSKALRNLIAAAAVAHSRHTRTHLRLARVQGSSASPFPQTSSPGRALPGLVLGRAPRPLVFLPPPTAERCQPLQPPLPKSTPPPGGCRSDTGTAARGPGSQ